MLLPSLSLHSRRAILASTVAFSWLVANPLLPAGFDGNASTLGAAFAKGDHGGHGHNHGKGANNGHHGKHKGTSASDPTDDDDDSETDDDNGDDDSDSSDDDSSDDDSADDDSADSSDD
jgi:hypothetical protein